MGPFSFTGGAPRCQGRATEHGVGVSAGGDANRSPHAVLPLGFGHSRQRCTEEKLPCCYHCGSSLHQARGCTEPVKCPLCSSLGRPDGHRMERKACPRPSPKGGKIRGGRGRSAVGAASFLRSPASTPPPSQAEVAMEVEVETGSKSSAAAPPGSNKGAQDEGQKASLSVPTGSTVEEMEVGSAPPAKKRGDSAVRAAPTFSYNSSGEGSSFPPVKRSKGGKQSRPGPKCSKDYTEEHNEQARGQAGNWTCIH